MSNGKTVLVLGGNGFIGSHIVDVLVERGYAVKAFDRFQPGVKTLFKSHPRIELINGDFLNRSDLEAATEGVSVVYHLISTTNPATAEKDPLIDIETNIKGSVVLFQVCREQPSVKHVVFLSSGGTVYGDNEGAVDEEATTKPISPYGIGKLTIENYLRYFKKQGAFDYTVFRLANPYGERQPFWKKQGAISIFFHNIINNEPVTVYGDGSMVRDYIYVLDAVHKIVDALEHNPKHEVYNIGSGVGESVADIIHAIENVSGVKAQTVSRDTPSSFVKNSVLNVKRYDEEFGRSQRATSLQEGMLLTYNYMMSFKDSGLL